MQAIVADTTPLNYLLLIQATDILPELYRTVLIPPAVKAELAHANTPAVVRAWISQPPAWLEVVSLKRPVDSGSQLPTMQEAAKSTRARRRECLHEPARPSQREGSKPFDTVLEEYRLLG